MADLHALLDQGEEDVAQEVSAVLTEVADEFAQQLANATELVAARFSLSRIARMFTDRMPRIVRRLLRVSEDASQHAADTTGGELPPEWEDLPGRYDDGRPLPPAMSSYVTTTEHLLRAVGARLAEVAREELAAGVDAGEDIDRLRARLREAFARAGAQLGEVREERIARTEAGRAWNTATLAAARAVTGPAAPIVKQWITRRDDRVRHDHKDANGQIRLLDEQFTVGEARMDAPHDPTAPADQVINCRCILAVYPESSAAAYEVQAPSATPLAKPRETRMASLESQTYHGTPGRPSYRKYHPGGRTRSGRTRHSNGGWLGSDRFSEDEHSTVLRRYTGNGYTSMNNSLRHGTYPKSEVARERVRNEVSVLSDLINVQEPTTSETTLYRRMEHSRLELNDGDEFHDKGFVSTSRREDVLPIETEDGDPNYTFFKITAPKGAQLLDVPSVRGVSFGADEQEVILPPGTKFRVKKVVDRGDSSKPTYYELEVTNAVVTAADAGPFYEPSAKLAMGLTAAEEDGNFQDRISWQPDDVTIDKRAKSQASAAVTAAAGEHTGAMIALVPSDEDLARLAIDGGEPADQLHLTMWFLGKADVFPDHERASLIDLMREELTARQLGPVSARTFGVNRWNGNGDEPCWVWAVSDDTSDDRPADSPYLHELRDVAAYGLRNSELDEHQVPDQHSPWVAHITAAYGDGDLLAELEGRLGAVTFDRVRIAFADEYTDIPLGPQQEEDPMPAQLAQADQVVAEPITTRAWSTPGDTGLAFEDEETGDGRVFAPGSLYWDRDPMPLQYADEMGMGHAGAELCGAINTVMRDGNRITSAGVLYLNRYAGLDAVMLLEQEAPLGVSVDLDDVDIEFVDKTMDPEEDGWLFASAHLASASVLRLDDYSVMLSGSSRAEWAASSGGHMARNRFDLQLITGPGGVVNANTIRTAFARSGVLTAAAGDPDNPDEGVVIQSEKAGDFLIRITRARLRGATLVAMPAYNRARIVLDPVEETASSSAPAVLTAASDAHERVVTYVCTSPVAVGAREVATALDISMESARGHLGRAAKNGRIVRLAPGQYVGPSTLPEGEVTAAMSGNLELPVHDDREAAWDGDEARSRVLDWATDEQGNANADKLGSAFLWRDPDADPATVGAYKLGYADVFDNDGTPRLEIVANGVYAAAAVLQGAMGGVDVPEDEMDGLRSRVEDLYGRLATAYDDDSITPPWTDEEEIAAAILEGLEASAWRAMQDMPPMPAEWFKEPTAEELPPGSGGVYYKDGRVCGWVAQAGVPHAGYPGKKLTIEKLAREGLDFSHFLRTQFRLDDGSEVRVGAMTMNVGHHRDGAQCENAACQFDNSGTVGAIVTVGMNAGGMWFSGAGAPWLSDWDKAVFRACQPSYHLRPRKGGGWELRAVLDVPVPGHSSPLVAAVIERSNLALAASAAGLTPLPDTESGHDPDAVWTASASSADTAPDLPGQPPGVESGQRPDSVSGQSAARDVDELVAALTSGPVIDRLLDAIALREAERRAEIEAMAASLAATPQEITASAAPKGNI